LLKNFTRLSKGVDEDLNIVATAAEELQTTARLMLGTAEDTESQALAVASASEEASAERVGTARG